VWAGQYEESSVRAMRNKTVQTCLLFLLSKDTIGYFTSFLNHPYVSYGGYTKGGASYIHSQGVVGVKPAKHNHMHHNQKVRKNQGIAASERIEINSAANISEHDEKEFIDAETAPDFLEGDIAIPEGRSRLAVDFDKFPAKKWKNNTVPYRMSRNHTASEVLIIESALRTISFVSCLKFEKWDGKSKDYVHFHPDRRRKGCWSFIGRQGGRQQLSLEKPVGKDCNCFCSPGRALHEVMHALGFYHEHARSDRDKYIKIVKKNVRRGKFANFFTKSDDETARNFDYDYKSIMHYGPYFFSKNKRGKAATIIPKDPDATIGQREMLSKMDCMKINSLYNCFAGDQEHVRKIQMICAMVGI